MRLNTVKGIARTLSAVLSQAVEDEKIPANPALRVGRHLRRGDEPKHEVQPLTRDEAAHLVQSHASISTKSHQRRRVDMSAQRFATLIDWRRQQRAR